MTIQVNIPVELMALSQPASSASHTELCLTQRLENGRAALPLLPAVATAALDLANDPEASIAQFSELVSQDPPIAARFVATANSALYSRGLRIRSLHDAVARIGISGARDLVLQVVYGSTLSGLKRYQEQVRQSFRNSVLSAHVCRLIVNELDMDCRDPYLCGLLHDIGESRVYRILSELGFDIGDEEGRELVERYHPRAGGELLAKWKLPDELIDVCKKHADTNVPSSQELRLVRIADLLMPAIRAEAEGTALDIDGAQLELLDLKKSDAHVIVVKGAKVAKAS